MVWSKALAVGAGILFLVGLSAYVLVSLAKVAGVEQQQGQIPIKLTLLWMVVLVIVIWRHRFDFGARLPGRWESTWAAGPFALVLVAVNVYPGVQPPPSGAYLADHEIAALGEELLFRGLMMGMLLRYGAWPALIWSSVLFGVAHGPPVISDPSLMNLAYVVYSALVGFVLGAVRLHSGSILLPWVMHAAQNTSDAVSAGGYSDASLLATRVLTGALALPAGLWIMSQCRQGGSQPVVRLDP